MGRGVKARSECAGVLALQDSILAERGDGSRGDLNSCLGLAGKGGVWERGGAPPRGPQPGSPATEGSVRQALPWSGPAAPPVTLGREPQDHPCVSAAPSLPGGDGSPHPQFPPLRRMSEGAPALHFTIANKRLKMPEK